MAIRLSDHFTYRHILRFTAPSVLMMIFTSIYGIVDGFFVSNFVGKIPFAAINFIMPFLMILSAVGFMIGTGGTAVVSKAMGEGRGGRYDGDFCAGQAKKIRISVISAKIEPFFSQNMKIFT